MNTTILIPLLNPNEPDAVIVAVHVHENQRVARGDLLFTLETTKSTAEVCAEGEGYVVGLRCAEGQAVRAGDLFASLAAAPAEAGENHPQPSLPDTPKADRAPSSLPADLRITQPALALAQQLGIELASLPIGPLITEKMIRERAAAASQSPPPATVRQIAPFDPTAIIIYGGGGHGKALIDLIRALGMYRIVGLVDDAVEHGGLAAGATILGAPILGGGKALPDIYAQGVRLAVNAIGGISNIQVRIKVFRKLAENGFACPALVHPRALVEPSAALGPGAQVFAQAYVGSEARLGYGVIVNTGAIISHDCTLEDYVNISPGAMLAGNVQVGERSLVGMGVTVNLNVKIGTGVRIGNSAVIKADVPEGAIVRAGKIFPETG